MQDVSIVFYNISISQNMTYICVYI